MDRYDDTPLRSSPLSDVCADFASTLLSSAIRSPRYDIPWIDRKEKKINQKQPLQEVVTATDRYLFLPCLNLVQQEGQKRASGS
jgi:hypothetical protein